MRQPVRLTNMKKRTYTVEESAKILGIGRSAAYQAVGTGELPAIRIGRRWLVPVQALEQLLSSAKASTPENRIDTDAVR